MVGSTPFMPLCFIHSSHLCCALLCLQDKCLTFNSRIIPILDVRPTRRANYPSKVSLKRFSAWTVFHISPDRSLQNLRCIRNSSNRSYYSLVVSLTWFWHMGLYVGDWWRALYDYIFTLNPLLRLQDRCMPFHSTSYCVYVYHTNLLNYPSIVSTQVMQRIGLYVEEFTCMRWNYTHSQYCGF